MNFERSCRLSGIWLSAIFLLLIVVSAESLLKYAGFCAVVSAYAGLPKEISRVHYAAHWALIYGWTFVGAGALASVTMVATLRRLNWDMSPGLRGISYLGTALAMVAVSIGSLLAILSLALRLKLRR